MIKISTCSCFIPHTWLNSCSVTEILPVILLQDNRLFMQLFPLNTSAPALPTPFLFPRHLLYTADFESQVLHLSVQEKQVGQTSLYFKGSCLDLLVGLVSFLMDSHSKCSTYIEFPSTTAVLTLYSHSWCMDASWQSTFPGELRPGHPNCLHFFIRTWSFWGTGPGWMNKEYKEWLFTPRSSYSVCYLSGSKFPSPIPTFWRRTCQ